MLNHDKTGLKIFDNFQIDFDLPKWKEKIKKHRESNTDNNIPSTLPLIPNHRRGLNGGLATGGSFIRPNSISFFDGDNGNIVVAGGISKNSNEKDKKPSLFERIFGRKKLKRKKLEEQERQASNFNVEPMDLDMYDKILKEKQNKEIPEISVEEFFTSIKNSKEELVLLDERFKSYESGLEHLKNTGQIALYESMCCDLEIHRSESQLYATGNRKLVTEQNIIDFAKKAPRALELDWVKNFTRSIPKKVVDVKIKMDTLGIFDNYTVLHYNPYGTGSALTEQEKEAQKDPILFGVILGSQKLYYIGDWVDEYCDLTFDKMVETLGEAAISANDLTANVEMPSEK